jgi:signal peptidase II
VDWIQLPHWPVFNVSDSSIVCGGVLAVLLAGIGRRIDGSRAEHDAERAGGEAGLPPMADSPPAGPDTSDVSDVSP